MPTGKLINGEWRKEGYEKDSDGRFLRNPTTFRNWIKADGISSIYISNEGLKKPVILTILNSIITAVIPILTPVELFPKAQ